MRGIFVTGTDTGIGKTVVAAVLLSAARRAGSVCYWKPIQTGIEVDDDTETVRVLANCSELEILDEGFRLKRPLSPHLSASLSGESITVEKTLRFLDKYRQTFWIVEGAGGVLVPLNEDEMMIDLMKAVDLPVVIVARSGLGTINHSLLTIEVLRNRGLKILGLVLSGEPNPENRKAIGQYGNVAVLAEAPQLEKLDARQVNGLSKRIDLERFLIEFEGTGR